MERLLRRVGPGRETAAADGRLARSSSLTTNPTYADTLVTHATAAYTFADTVRKKITSDCIHRRVGYYQSWSGYNDELSGARSGCTGPPRGRLLPGQGRVVLRQPRTSPQSTTKSYNGRSHLGRQVLRRLRAASNKLTRQAEVPRRRQPLARLLDCR
ncbi:glycoside hydrolase family 9 protein [Streptosporangium vulgare]|uniref:glycoside hydrolase family 9 protein n=1 Tax=Streptosporangium vulgare TaxID=46190 RepID=UPI0031E3A5EE